MSSGSFKNITYKLFAYKFSLSLALSLSLYLSIYKWKS